MSAASPLPGRHGHAVVYDGEHDRLLSFGGSLGGNETSDVIGITLTPESEAFATLAAQGPAPLPRGATTAAYDAGSDRLLVYGGVHVSMIPYTDAHLLTLAPGRERWSPLATRPRPAPGREAHGVAYDPDQQRMVSAFGVTALGAGSVWQLDLRPGLESWTPLEALGTPRIAPRRR